MQQIWTFQFYWVVRQHILVRWTTYTLFVGNLPGFPAVKEFWKSVKIWRSYRRERVARFWDTVYIKFVIAPNERFWFKHVTSFWNQTSLTSTIVENRGYISCILTLLHSLQNIEDLGSVSVPFLTTTYRSNLWYTYDATPLDH